VESNRILGITLSYRLLNQRFLLVKLKSLLRTFYGRHRDFVNLYGVSVSQITTDLFPPFLIYDLSARVTRWMSPVEELLTIFEQRTSPEVFSGVRVVQYLVFCVVFCRSLFVLLSF